MLVIVLAGCKTTQPLAVKAVDRTDSELYKAIYDHNTDFTWFVADGNMKVDSPVEKVSAKVYLRMRKDSVIWSVVKKVGVEGGRMLVTPKSYAVINRIDGTYSRGSTNSILGQSNLNLTFTDVQQALFGNIMVPDTNSTTISRLGAMYTVHQPQTSQANKSSYVVNSETLRIDNIEIYTTLDQSLSVQFSNYQTTDTGHDLPHTRKVTINDRGIVSTIILEFKNISVDVPKSTKFSVPRHYEEVPSIF